MSDSASSKYRSLAAQKQTPFEIAESQPGGTCRRKIRVLHVIPTLNCGGAERVCMEIARGLNPSRFEATVLTLERLKASSLERELHSCGVRVQSLEKRQGSDPRMFLRFSQALQRNKPDILHTHLYVLPYVAPVLALKRIPCLHTVHSIAEKEAAGWVRVFNSFSFRIGTIPVGISPVVRESIRRIYHPTKVPLVPNGIDLRPFRNTRGTRESWRSRNGFLAEDFLIASVGRLHPLKNFFLLLCAFADLSSRYPNLKLMIAGEGPFRQDLERTIDELGIAGKVRLAGERSDIPHLLLSSDLYVNTSLWEGNPLSVIEAMAAGLPVIAPAVGGIPDLIENGTDGVILRPDNKDELVRAMANILDSQHLRSRLGEAARVKAHRTMGTSEMVRAYEELYEELLGPSSH